MQRQKSIQILPESLLNENLHPIISTVYLMNHIFQTSIPLRIYWYLFTILKTSSNFKTYSESVFNTLYIKIKKNSKKIFLDKVNVAKSALSFLSRAQTHPSFTFNLLFLYELNHDVRLSETICEIFHFRFHFVFIKVYIFVQQNVWTLWL